MPTYDDLIELAAICLRQARAAKSRAIAAELRRMVKEYEKRAAANQGLRRLRSARERRMLSEGTSSS
jgi:hypothetical protein